MSRLLAVGCLLFCVLPAPAQLEADLDKPYEVKIVLRVARHLNLTEVFRKRLQSELRDGLRAALGPMGNVEVLDLADLQLNGADPRGGPSVALLREMKEKQDLDILDNWRAITDSKLHFVFVSFDRGAYVIEARQYDGLTGLASPISRRLRTTDRQLVGRAASLMIDQDFGVVGTLPAGSVPGGPVTVSLRGGTLGVSLEPWVKKGDVFVVSRIASEGDQRQGQRVPWALLQVQEPPVGGLCKCLLHYRYQGALPEGAGVLGFRCLKISTTEGPLRMRFDQVDRIHSPLAGKRVTISTLNFDDKPREDLSTNAEGMIQTRASYKNIAFVKVGEGVTVARIPVEITEDQRLIICDVDLAPGAEQKGQLEVRRQDWLRRVYEQVQVQNVLVKELKGLVDTAKHDQAIDRAKGARGALQTDLLNLKKEQGALDKAAATAGLKLDLGDGEPRLGELQVSVDSLATLIADLERIKQRENDPKRKEWLKRIAQAQLAEREAEFEQAIDLYEKIQAETQDFPEVRKRLDQLKKEWTARDESHRTAQKFIYETWAKIEDIAAIREKLPEAQNALRVCRQAGDRLAPQKLQIANVKLASKLIDAPRQLEGKGGEDALQQLKIIAETGPELQTFIKEVADYLKGSKPPSP